jgi:hypothetical protein
MPICKPGPNPAIIAIQPKEINTGAKNVLTRRWKVFIVDRNLEREVILLREWTVPFILVSFFLWTPFSYFLQLFIPINSLPNLAISVKSVTSKYCPEYLVSI